ncbi:MAG: TlpA disulfide reductase family protein [Pyrinomonadaceae bacterium]
MKTYSPFKSLALIAMLTLTQVFALAAPPLLPQANFSLRSVDGTTVSSTGTRGKVIVLAVGALWLPLSRTQVQGVQKLADTYSGRDVEVYWVSTDSESHKSKNYASDDQLREFAAKYDLKVKVLRDPDGQTSKELGADQVPALIIIDKQGNVSGNPIGGLNAQGNIVRTTRIQTDQTALMPQQHNPYKKRGDA